MNQVDVEQQNENVKIFQASIAILDISSIPVILENRIRRLFKPHFPSKLFASDDHVNKWLEQFIEQPVGEVV